MCINENRDLNKLLKSRELFPRQEFSRDISMFDSLLLNKLFTLIELNRFMNVCIYKVFKKNPLFKKNHPGVFGIKNLALDFQKYFSF